MFFTGTKRLNKKRGSAGVDGRGRTRSRRRRFGSGMEQLEPRTLLAGDFWLVGPTDSIQSAVDNAAEGDIILIKPGVYNESVFINKSLTLAGLTLDPSKVVITPNDGNTGTDGIIVESGAKFVVLKNMRVTGWEDDGILVFGDRISTATLVNGVGTDVTIHNVIADFNGDDGIELNDIGNAWLSHVKANFNDGAGLDVDGASGSLSIVTSWFNENGDDSNDYGLDLDDVAGKIKLVGVTANWNYDDGLNVEFAGDVDICLSHFSFNGILTGGGFGADDADGIDLQGVGNVSLHLVKAESNHEDGLDIDAVFNSNAAVAQNSVASNGDVIIKESTFTKNGIAAEDFSGDGIDLDNIGKLVLFKVHASWNFFDGLGVEDAGNVSLSFSHFDDNGEDGVDLDRVGDVLAHAIAAKRNGDDGFDVDGGGSVAIFFSKFNDNDDDGVDIDGVNVDPLLVAVLAMGNGDFDIEPTNQNF